MEGFYTPCAVKRYCTILFCLEKNLQDHSLFDFQLGRLIGQYALYDKKEHTIENARTKFVAEFVWEDPYTQVEKTQALINAIKNRYLDVAEFLVAQGAHINVCGYEEIIKEEDLELVSFLVNKLHVFIPEGIFFAARHGRVDIIKYLLDYDVYDDNEEAIEEAIRNNHLNVVKFFLNNYDEVKPNSLFSPEDRGYNYMNIACRYGKLDIVKYLSNYMNNLSLCNACIPDHLTLVKYLIESGANIHEQNDAALFFAANSGHFEVALYLLSQGACVTESSLKTSIMNRNYKIYHCQKFYSCLLKIKILVN